MTPSAHVMWHDVECGAYDADLPLWRELAREANGPVLDVGAGTGRVALRLAQAGHAVTALDRDPELLEALTERARQAEVGVETVVADATAFDLGPGRFALIAVPMQTIQLLDGATARGRFFACARRALGPGGLVALAIFDALEGFEEPSELPLPDLGEAGGWRFVSQPVAVRDAPGSVRIERVRQTIAPDGRRASEDDAIELARVSGVQLAAEAAPHGLRAEAPRNVGPTAEHVGSEVVLLRG